MKWAAALLVLAAFGCGGGSDGQPVTPPPSSPAPAPTSEPPGSVTGIRVTDRGEGWIEWAWDPVPGATGYEADVFPEGTPPGERGTPVFVEAPKHRREKLVAGESYMIFVRARADEASGEWTAGPTVRAETEPEPPGAVTGIRVTYRGQGWIAWAWDPVPGATGYELSVLPEGTPLESRSAGILVEGPWHRRHGLVAGESYTIFVRARAGEVPGEWSTGPTARTETAEVFSLEPGPCSDERDRVLRWDGTGIPLARAWNPQEPFRLWVDPALPESATQVGEFARRIEDRLGYSIILADLVKSDHEADAIVIPITDYGGAYARPRGRDGKPPLVGVGPGQDGGTGLIDHEVGHLLGMKHHLCANADGDGTYGEFHPDLIEMTAALTCFRSVALPPDLDALGCAFPHPDFPR